jgi:hypothetical protein
MNQDNFRTTSLIFLAIIFLLTFMNTCNSCNTSTQFKKVNQKIDSTRVSVDVLKKQILTYDVATVLIEREGLETEKRTLLNTNQIFLTRKRPDERVLEIDKQIKKLNKIIEKNGN